MPTIGNTDVANLGEAGLDFDWEISLNKDDVLVCPASQTLTEFNCRVDTSEFAAGTNTIEIGIHDVTTGYAAAPLIASQIINIDLSLIPYVASVAGLSIDLAAYAGQTLAIGHARAIQNSGDMAAGFESGSASRSASMSTALVNPHVENDTVNYVRKGMWAELVGAADTTDPVLVLGGANPDTFVSGNASSYVDLGANWTDNVDGSGTVTADNSPTDFIAAQLLNYNFTDAAGNAAVQVQRTVNVTVDAGHTKVDLVDPAPATAGNLLGGYTPSAPITGMQLVHESVTDQGIAVTSDAAGNPTFATVPTVTQTLSRFTIDSDGNRNAAAVYTYTVEVSAAPVITGPAIVSIAENSTAVASYVISNRGGEAPTLTGADAAYFGLTATGGDGFDLAFLSTQNYENPQDQFNVNGYKTTINIDNLVDDAVAENILIEVNNILEQAITDQGDLSVEVPYGAAGLTKTDALFTSWVALFSTADSNNSASLPVILLISNGAYSVTFSKADAPDLIRTFTVTEAAGIAPSLPATLNRNVMAGGGSITFAAASGTPVITYVLSGTDAALFNLVGLTATLITGSFITDDTYSMTMAASSAHGADSTQIITLTVTEQSPGKQSKLSITVGIGI